MNETELKKMTKVRFGTMILVCLGVLSVGLVGFKVLSDMKSPPQKKWMEESVLPVEIIRSRFEDVQVHIVGYGEVTSLNKMTISPGVAGHVVYTHPRLESGEIISKGDILFEIDSTDFHLTFETAKKRLQTLKRNLTLSKMKFHRLIKLHKNNKIVTLQEVEDAESSYNNASDQIERLKGEIKSAEISMNRCVIRSPFHSRVVQVSLEKGQYVTPGNSVLELANDEILEVEIPLDSGKVFSNMAFRVEKKNRKVSWFSDLQPVEVKVIWSQGNGEVVMVGAVHRIVKFDPESRNIYVAVRIDSQDPRNQAISGFPIVDGMFCKVIIPGKVKKDLIRLPKQAVSFDNIVYISNGNRLEKRIVEVEEYQEEDALISSGLKAGESIIVTRLTAPVENTLLIVTERKPVSYATIR